MPRTVAVAFTFTLISLLLTTMAHAGLERDLFSTKVGELQITTSGTDPAELTDIMKGVSETEVRIREMP
jgi:hypothetical protein